MRNDNTKYILISILIILLTIWAIGKYQLTASARGGDPFAEPVKIRATCYCDDGATASGCNTRYGIVASKPEYIGCVACVYAIADDGSIGDFIGYFEVLDTGYGRETGKGQSSILQGKSLGTIETGETIDFYIPTMHQVEEWMDKYGDFVFIKLYNGKG